MVIDREIGQEMRCLGKRVDKNNWDGGSGAKPPYEVYFLVHSAPSGSSFSILSSGFFRPKAPLRTRAPRDPERFGLELGTLTGPSENFRPNE